MHAEIGTLVDIYFDDDGFDWTCAPGGYRACRSPPISDFMILGGGDDQRIGRDVARW